MRLRKDGTPAKRPNWDVVLEREADIAALQANAQHDRTIIDRLEAERTQLGQIIAEGRVREDALCLDLVEAQGRLATQADTIRATTETAEHAVAEAWTAKADAQAYAGRDVVGMLAVSGMAALVFGTLGFILGAGGR